MVVSVHLADVGPRRATAILSRPPSQVAVRGLTYSETVRWRTFAAMREYAYGKTGSHHAATWPA
jgi:hypothetical protein